METGEHEEDPERKADTVENGLFCFFDGDRECRSDCMAFTIEESESKALSSQQRNCTILVSVERIGRYMGGLISLVRKEQADKARTSHPAPPTPR